MTGRWRVVRQSDGADVCTRHRFERFAWRCARRHERAEDNGVWFDVRPAVNAR